MLCLGAIIIIFLQESRHCVWQLLHHHCNQQQQQQQLNLIPSNWALSPLFNINAQVFASRAKLSTNAALQSFYQSSLLPPQSAPPADRNLLHNQTSKDVNHISSSSQSGVRWECLRSELKYLKMIGSVASERLKFSETAQGCGAWCTKNRFLEQLLVDSRPSGRISKQCWGHGDSDSAKETQWRNLGCGMSLRNRK